MPNVQNNLKVMRSWENSKEISELYYLLSRNKKQIKELSKKYFIKQGLTNVIHVENLVDILMKTFPDLKLNINRWKLVVNIADRERNSLIDVDLFFVKRFAVYNCDTFHRNFICIFGWKYLEI